jgi:iron(II)-dependent oxidoreductase
MGAAKFSIDSVVGLAGLLGLLTGLLVGQWHLGLAAISAGVCYLAARRWSSTCAAEPCDIFSKAATFGEPLGRDKPFRAERVRITVREQGLRSEIGPLVDKMLAEGRCALLLREQLIGNLNPERLQCAVQAFNHAMSLVPEGSVLVRSGRLENTDSRDEQTGDRLVNVESVYLDRYCVTNQQFQRFVAAGCYEQASLWDLEIRPGVAGFVDRTGRPGPRFWQGGTFPSDQPNHPVVGVSWYEAVAYARWVGKRLPTDAEWIKACGWPVPTSTSRPKQRTYPWGETMDLRFANLWGSGANGIVAVDQFPDGASVGGVFQLIGNVWEWTRSSFGAWDAASRRLDGDLPMKSIRGGAFDTYFDNQATCQFQSGDSSTSRKHNIGFRCALGVCDLAAVVRRQLANSRPDAAQQDVSAACGAMEAIGV